MTNNYYQEKYRPQYHFSPEKAWMNDPNGMVYYEGEYHLFYQYYPDEMKWGPMHWGHAVSEDLVHWEHLPVGLFPDELGYIFSGSAVVDWQNTTGFGVDGKPPLVAMFTYHDVVLKAKGGNNHESQALAYSNDKGRTWTKYEGNPVLPNPGALCDFRDPKVGWDKERGQWLMTLATTHKAMIYSSPNLKDWTLLSEWGEEYGEHRGVWECPDLIPMKVENADETKWLLIQNLNPGSPLGGSATQYFVGDFDGEDFILDERFKEDVVDGKAVWLDQGRDNYAGVTWADVPSEDGRKLFIGWMSNWEYGQEVPTSPWRSAMTIPRSLALHQTHLGYRLFVEPIEELAQLRIMGQEFEAKLVESTCELPVTALHQAELALEFGLAQSSAKAIGFSLSNDLGEVYEFAYDIDLQQFSSNRTKVGNHDFSEKFANIITTTQRISQNPTLKMHCFLESASIELFLDDGANSITEIFFPTEGFNKLTIFTKDGSAQLLSAKAYLLDGIWS